MSRIGFLFVALFLLPAYGQDFKIKSEMEKTDYILLSPYLSASAVYAYERGLSPDDSSRASRERISIYEDLIKNFPETTFVLYLTKSIPDVDGFALDKSEYDLWLEKYQDQKNVILMASYASEKEIPSVWIRDWGPHATDHDKKYVSFQGNDFIEHQKLLVETLNCPPKGEDGVQRVLEFADDNMKVLEQVILLANDEVLVDGGDFMTNKKGDCFIADHRDETYFSSLTKYGCKDVHLLEALPGESTGHIDIFAKFIKEDTILISQYDSNDVQLTEQENIVYFSCRKEDIQKKQWHGCDYKKQTGATSTELAKNVKLTQDDLKKYSDDPLELYDWVGHSKKIQSEIHRKGFKTVVVKTPSPVASREVTIYLDEAGNEVHREKNINLFFPTYTNSLIIDGGVALPAYKDFATQTQNTAARKVYEKHFSKVVPMFSDSNITLGGSIHCLTKEL